MSNSYSWYQQLIKPTWAPPSWLFGPVWTVLYVIIAVSFGTVFYKVFKRELPVVILIPFILNLIFNLSFTYLQFGLKNNILAGIDVLLVLITLVWAMIAIYPHIKWVAIANIPYLLWVCFATVLQLTVTYLNR
ncbi:MAG TPA: TspO/MBR family protein [Candidatus Paceibacterota bacterium]|jgi:tryptophan-rich sensory protein|nr:TspO/MBR family protein [Candidatus Paceibacterota bacterium]